MRVASRRSPPIGAPMPACGVVSEYSSVHTSARTLLRASALVQDGFRRTLTRQQTSCRIDRQPFDARPIRGDRDHYRHGTDRSGHRWTDLNPPKPRPGGDPTRPPLQRRYRYAQRRCDRPHALVATPLLRILDGLLSECRRLAPAQSAVKILTIGGFAKGGQGLVHHLLLARRTVDHFHVRDQAGCGEVLHARHIQAQPLGVTQCSST